MKLNIFYTTFFTHLLLLTWGFADANERIGRLMVHIEPTACFSPEEFSREAAAHLVEIDTRNPFPAFKDIFLERPFVVLSSSLPERRLWALSKKFGYRFVSFSEETLEQAVDTVQTLLKKIPTSSSKIPCLSDDDANGIYDLMRKADQVLTAKGITYWATAGTLLGAIRHQGLIPWDDDLDVCILDDDEGKLKDIEEALNLAGLGLYYWPELKLYKIFPIDGLPIEDAEDPGLFRPYSFPFLDVFVVALEKGREFEDLYAHQSSWAYLVFNKEKFMYSQIKGIMRVPFGPLRIPIPGDPEDFLNANFGTQDIPDLWKRYALEPEWNHKLAKPQEYDGCALVELDSGV